MCEILSRYVEAGRQVYPKPKPNSDTGVKSNNGRYCGSVDQYSISCNFLPTLLLAAAFSLGRLLPSSFLSACSSIPASKNPSVWGGTHGQPRVSQSS